MPAKKTVKKPVAKPATAKKTTVKKTAAKKPAAKKVVVEEVKEVAPEMHECACGHECKCDRDCKCGCHGGSKFGRFIMKLIIVLIIFALGFAAAKFVDGGRDFRGPRVDFDNGCLDVSSVKCPEMQAVLPIMDVDGDGCITRDEYRAVKQEMRRQMRAAGMQEIED